MTDPTQTRLVSDKPFGAEQPRSWTPVIVLAALYVLMMLFMAWMAFFHTGKP